MQKYKVVASKSQKKYTLILSADSEVEAKEKLHKEGYSILTIEKVGDEIISGKKFLFQIEKDGEIKKGIILGEDIFKIYVKLRKELGYNIISLFPEGDNATGDAQMQAEILEKLKILYERQFTDEISIRENIKKDEAFFLKQRVEETAKLIDRAIEKIQNLIEKHVQYEINDEKLEKLQQVYEKLVQFRKSTNITKLQEVGEFALEKVAEIELEYLEKNKSKESRALLSETNTLLKKMGSGKHYIESNRDIKKMFQSFFRTLQEKAEEKKEFNQEIKRKNQEEKLDKNSFTYLKTLLLLEKYEKKQKEIQKELFQIIFSRKKKEIREKLKVKLGVIKQNISLLKAKKDGKLTSYTYAKKGFSKIQDFIQIYMNFLAKVFFFILYLLSISFFFFEIFHISENFSFVKYGLILGVTTYGISRIKGVGSLSFFIVFFFVFYIIFQINF